MVRFGKPKQALTFRVVRQTRKALIVQYEQNGGSTSGCFAIGILGRRAKLAQRSADELNSGIDLEGIDTTKSLPSEKAGGVDFFAELNVWLLARGPWRATVSVNDFLYVDEAYQATGASLAMLYHRAVGPICVAARRLRG